MFWEENTFDDIDKELFNACGFDLVTRIILFVVLLLVGWLISGLSFISILDPTRFCIFYTIGNILSLVSTCLLWGPCNQIRNMTKHKRIIASILYVGFMVMTLVSAVRGWPLGVTLLFAACQLLASVWYLLSYTPYARSGVKLIASKLCC